MSTTIASLNAARPAGAATLRASKTVALRAAPVARRSAGRASVVTTRAAVDASVAYAVAQQDLFFAAVVAGECLYQQGNLPADFKGRPSLTDLPVPCGMLVGSFALIQTDQPLLSPAGLLLGAAACAAAGKYFLDRYDAIDDDGMDWPGTAHLSGNRTPLLPLRPPRRPRGAPSHHGRVLIFVEHERICETGSDTT